MVVAAGGIYPRDDADGSVWIGDHLELLVCLQGAFYFTESVYTVVSQKSILTQFRQLVLYMSNNEG